MLLVSLALCGCNRSASHYLEAGNSFTKQGKLEDAVISYQKATQIDPKFGEAYYRLGLTQIKLNRGVEALTALSQAAQNLPDRPEVQAQYGRVLLSAYLTEPRRPKVLYDQLNDLSGKIASKDPNSFEAFRIRGFLALSDHKPAEAVELFSKARAAQPADSDNVIVLAQALIQAGKPDEGEKLARELIGRDKTFATSYDVLYRYYRGLGKHAEAEAVLKQKLANLPQDPDTPIQLASFYYDRGDKAASESTLEQVRKSPAGASAAAHLRLGDFYRARSSADQAAREYQQCCRGTSTEAAACRRNLSDVLAGSGKLPEAIQAWDDHLKEQPNDSEARKYRAGLLLRVGKPDEALREFGALAQANPNDPLTRFWMGEAARAKGDLQRARTEYREAITRDPGLAPPKIALAELSLSSKEYADALRYTDDLVNAGNKDPRVSLLRATALMGESRFPEARAVLRELTRNYPNYLDATLQTGLLELAEKRYVESERIFQQLHKLGQSDLRATEGLAAVYVATKRPDRALQLWADELKLAPNSAAARRAYAAAAAAAGKYDVSVREYQRLIADSPSTGPLYLALGNVYLLQGDTNNSQAMFEKAKQLSADSYAASSLGFVQQISGQEGAEQSYREALKLNPDDFVAMNNLAYLLAEKGRELDEALRLAARAHQLKPENPEFSDTLAWVYLKKNMPSNAVQLLAPLASKYPGSPQFRHHYGLALLASGDKVKARQELEAALKAQPSPQVERQIREALNKF